MVDTKNGGMESFRHFSIKFSDGEFKKMSDKGQTLRVLHAYFLWVHAWRSSPSVPARYFVLEK